MSGVAIIKTVNSSVERFYKPLLLNELWSLVCTQTEQCLRPSPVKLCGIYAICNCNRPRVYIGGSVNIYSRWRLHLSQLKHGEHRTAELQQDWKEGGYESFVFCVLELCSQSKIEVQERFWLKICNEYLPSCPYNKYLEAKYVVL
ncbi:MAG: GIY-YIG nuclease family protein [Nostoc sp. NMS7]|uniref:GIY-YIG nuclease family protein n=1 Tax=Nostoc sp. NMS7 TaxID=2815391 RepID=UPI0025F59B26|nr:GIY-YIG nuclease family protein [Nostoc sp. NMS7]MBN3945930.1 GIY-YIG nuclease family protein [Nostoc sp. NMS7]